MGLINGFKLELSDPRHRIWIGRAYNAFARALFRIRLQDIDCDYRLIRRDLLQDLNLTSTSFEQLVCLHFRIVTVPLVASAAARMWRGASLSAVSAGKSANSADR